MDKEKIVRRTIASWSAGERHWMDARDIRYLAQRIVADLEEAEKNANAAP